MNSQDCGQREWVPSPVELRSSSVPNPAWPEGKSLDLPVVWKAYLQDGFPKEVTR